MPSFEMRGRSLDDDRESAAGRVAPPVPQVPAVLALQCTAGNHAVAALMAATQAHAPRLARKPDEWAAEQAAQNVLALLRIRAASRADRCSCSSQATARSPERCRCQPPS
jgi:hypothetical protein